MTYQSEGTLPDEVNSSELVDLTLIDMKYAQKLRDSGAEEFMIPTLLYQHGKEELGQGRPEAAERIFRAAAAEIHQGVRWPWIGVIQALTHQGRHRDAVEQSLMAALNLSDSQQEPAVPLPWWLFSGAVINQPSAEMLRDIVSRYPDHQETLISLSIVELGQGNKEPGTAAMARAASLHWPTPADKANHSLYHVERKKPSFLILGQQKAGTTALFERLTQHSLIDSPLLKEPSYWSLNYHWGERWYANVFAPAEHRPKAMTFEASTSYFNHPSAPSRLASKAPNTKLIVVLRDAVSRVYSEYHQYVRLGMEARAWDDIVEAEMATLNHCPMETEAINAGDLFSSFLLRAATLPHLRRWLSHFPSEQLLILSHQQMIIDPEAVMDQIHAFLCVPPQRDVAFKRLNEGHYPQMNLRTEERLRQWFADHDQALEQFIEM